MKKKDFSLNRKSYERIKKYDHQQMEAYYRRIYEDGYTAGMKEGMAKIPDLTGLEDRLQMVKGIGPAKANMIFQEVLQFLAPSGEKKD